MNPSRQRERRARFRDALAAMPYFETWSLPEIEGVVTLDGVSGKKIPRGNFRRVSRRMRRVMARVKSKREYRGAHGLV